MNKIKFGVSINKVGALTIVNFRTRTVKNSFLDKSLHQAWSEILDRIHSEDLMYTNHKYTESEKYSVHDFTCANKGFFFDIIYPIIKRNLLNAEIKQLEDKYKSLNISVKVESLPSEEEYENWVLDPPLL
jgi:hypothetical protein